METTARRIVEHRYPTGRIIFLLFVLIASLAFIFYDLTKKQEPIPQREAVIVTPITSIPTQRPLPTIPSRSTPTPAITFSCLDLIEELRYLTPITDIQTKENVWPDGFKDIQYHIYVNGHTVVCNSAIIIFAGCNATTTPALPVTPDLTTSFASYWLWPYIEIPAVQSTKDCADCN